MQKKCCSETPSIIYMYRERKFESTFGCYYRRVGTKKMLFKHYPFRKRGGGGERERERERKKEREREIGRGRARV